MFRSYAPSPIPGTVGPSHAPQNLPIRFNHLTGGTGGQVLRPIKGISIAFGQPFGTEIPLWSHLEDMGPTA